MYQKKVRKSMTEVVEKYNQRTLLEKIKNKIVEKKKQKNLPKKKKNRIISLKISIQSTRIIFPKINSKYSTTEIGLLHKLTNLYVSKKVRKSMTKVVEKIQPEKQLFSK